MKGFFGEVFDLNRDGKLSNRELAADFAAFMTLMDGDDESESDDEESEE